MKVVKKTIIHISGTLKRKKILTVVEAIKKDSQTKLEYKYNKLRRHSSWFITSHINRYYTH